MTTTSRFCTERDRFVFRKCKCRKWQIGFLSATTIHISGLCYSFKRLCESLLVQQRRLRALFEAQTPHTLPYG